MPLLLLSHHARRRHDGDMWERGIGPALFFTDDLAARSRRQFFVVPSPREFHRRRRVASRVASTAPRCCSRRDYAWPLWLLAWTVSVLLSVMATATFRRAATSTPGAVPRCAKDEWARRRVELNQQVNREKYCGDLRGPPRHRADPVPGTTPRRWRGSSRRRTDPVMGTTLRRWREAPEI